jgi:hypothetical protein
LVTCINPGDVVAPVRFAFNSVGAVARTNDPDPVDVVVPEPPSATANGVIRLRSLIVVVPVSVGAFARTTDPVPVAVVTPVPPFSTGNGTL